MTRTLVATGAVLAFLAVGLGAFGAHGLRDRVTPEALAIYQTGVQYHAMHSLALLLLAALTPHMRLSPWTARLFVAGIVIFSGSLYALAMTGQKWLGAITPIGGLCFLAGWLILAFSGRNHPGTESKNET